MQSAYLYIRDSNESFFRAYKEIYQGLVSHKEKIRLDNIDKATISSVLDMVILNEPYILGVESYSYVEGGTYQYTIFPDYRFSKEEEHQILTDIEHRIVRLCKPVKTASDYQKVLYVHNLLIKNLDYSTDGDPHSILQPFKTGTCVCDGFSKIMKKMLDYLDVDNIVVGGTSQGEQHAWNLISIEGGWYHTDLTYDNAQSYRGQFQYAYHNLTDSQIMRDHIFDTNMYPSTPNHDLNYYTMTGMTANSRGALERLIQSMVQSQGTLIVRLVGSLSFKDEEAIESMTSDILNLNAAGGYLYSYDGTTNMLCIQLEG